MSNTVEQVSKDALNILTKSLNGNTSISGDDRKLMKELLEQLVKLNQWTTLKKAFYWIGNIVATLSLGAIVISAVGIITVVCFNFKELRMMFDVFKKGNQSNHWDTLAVKFSKDPTKSAQVQKALNATSKFVPPSVADGLGNVSQLVKKGERIEMMDQAKRKH